MPVGVKFVELILKPAREGLEKKRTSNSAGGQGSAPTLPCLFLIIKKSVKKGKRLFVSNILLLLISFV
jgi:hypothetical protein